MKDSQFFVSHVKQRRQMVDAQKLAMSADGRCGETNFGAGFGLNRLQCRLSFDVVVSGRVSPCEHPSTLRTDSRRVQ